MTGATGTLNQLFHQTAEKFATRVALRYKEKKQYHDITYAELARRVERAASGLAAFGVVKGDRVSLISENRPEWAITDLAALSLGAIVVPIYPTLPSAQVGYILRNSAARVVVVENAKQFAKIQDARGAGLPDLQQVVLMEAKEPVADVVMFPALLERGDSEPLGANAYANSWKSVGLDDVASLVYTSGTTGDPKGAMLTHGNFVFDVDGSIQHYVEGGAPLSEEDVFFSFLPLSHAYERTTGHYLPLRLGASICYADGVRTLVEDMAAVKPTIMVCVPRIYEAMRERILDTVAKAPENKQKLFKTAIEAGEAYAAAKIAGRSPGVIGGVKHAIFEKLVYAKLRDRFGGRFRFFVSGGAALSPDTARFFLAIGIPISEGYGMTEASPVMSTNPVNHTKVGTVGRVLPNAEFKIAQDGEILYRGANVMKGYWQNPTATAEMVDADGWLHTGDIGQLDSEQYLKITDRKKDIIVLGNGKNVAPQPIEQAIKESPYVSEIVLIGDKQSVITALVLPNKAKVGDWAKGQNLTFADDDALLALPEVRKLIKGEIDSRTRDRADFERVKKFTLLNTSFTVESGEMTPTLKIKRKVVMRNYEKEIAAMRGGDEG